MLIPRYRRDYDGEFILVDHDLIDGKSIQRREWIDNPVVNQHISGRAAVIASRVLHGGFKWFRLERHRGGLLGKKRLQTYGTGDLWRDMRFDFFVESSTKEIQDIVEKKYDQQSIVYSSIKNCLAYPGHFYPVPFQPPLDYLAQAVYLAAFDGHQEIFMLGYNLDTEHGTARWVKNVAEVMSAYASTKFWLLGNHNFPSIWLENHNVEMMTFERFITYCDI